MGKSKLAAESRIKREIFIDISYSTKVDLRYERNLKMTEGTDATSCAKDARCEKVINSTLPRSLSHPAHSSEFPNLEPGLRMVNSKPNLTLRLLQKTDIADLLRMCAAFCIGTSLSVQKASAECVPEIECLLSRFCQFFLPSERGRRTNSLRMKTPALGSKRVSRTVQLCMVKTNRVLPSTRQALLSCHHRPGD